VIVAIRKLTQSVLHLELSRACPVFLSCLSFLTKQPFVLQITVRMCLFVTSTVATQFTSLPTVQVTLFQTKCTTTVTVESFPHSCYLYFGVSDLIEFNMKSLLSLISSTDRCILKYQVFPASRNSNDISVYNWPHKGTCLPF